jgi:hypothetical protein
MSQSIEYFRSKHHRFTYEAYNVQYDKGKLVFSFSFRIDPNITFSPSITFHGVKPEIFSGLSNDILNNIAFHLGLAEIPSYWKATCAPEIFIKAGVLDKYQTDWWRKLLINGMGEFFFTNQIDFTPSDFVNIFSSGVNHNAGLAFSPDSQRNRLLIPIGGGKDSIVTLNILESHRDKYHVGCFVLNPIPAAVNIIRQSNCDELIQVSRTIDSNLIRLNSEGYLNGHTPFSSVLGFISVACAIFFNYRFVILSNERSSDEENTSYLGRKINHQYSKSFEFENLFREYISTYLHSNLQFFSFLRPLYEIQIARYFSKLKNYHSIFLSCNRGQKENKWCNSCPKCLSTYLLLSPFMENSELIKIFSADIFQNSDLEYLAIQLVSKEKNKPFECVGTYEESLIAFYLNIKKRSGEKNLPYLLKIVNIKVLDNEIVDDVRAQSLLNSWNNDNNLPDEFADFLKESTGLN